MTILKSRELKEVIKNKIQRKANIMTKKELQKLHTLHDQGDLDLLLYLKGVCNEEDKPEVELLIYLNETVGIGFGEPSSPEYEEEFNAREEEYFERKFALLSKYDSRESWG